MTSGREVCLTLLAVVICANAEHQQLRTPRSLQAALATDVAKATNFITQAKPGSLSKEEKEVLDFKSMALMNTGEVVVSFVIWVGLYALFAAYYRYNVYCMPVPDLELEEKEKAINFSDFKDWKSGLCACTEFHDITFWSCVCPGIRWADTMDKLNIHRFWPAFWFLTAIFCIGFLPIFTPVCFFIVACYMTKHRQQFREKFEFESQGGATWVSDFFAMCCCMCCGVAQEARHMRRACIVEHPAVDKHCYGENRRNW